MVEKTGPRFMPFPGEMESDGPHPLWDPGTPLNTPASPSPVIHMQGPPSLGICQVWLGWGSVWPGAPSGLRLGP